MSDFTNGGTDELSRHDIEELIGAYALDAVDEAERAAVERLLETDKALRDELDSYLAVAATLAQAVESAPSTPSPAVWEGIAAGMARTARVDPPPPLQTPSRLQRQRWFGWASVAISAAAVVAALALGARMVDLQRQLDEQNADQITAALNATLAQPTSKVSVLRAPEGAPAAEASVVVGDNGIGYVYSDSLPALEADRTYQLWAIVDGKVISAGILGNDPEVSPFQVVGNIEGFAITEEVAGGVVSSENDPVAVWLDA